MVQPRRWIQTLSVGLALACEAASVQAQQVAAVGPAPARQAQFGQPADYTIDLPSDEELDYQDHQGVGENQLLEESDAALEARPLQVDEPPLPEGPQTEKIKERFPNGSIKIEREVTQDAQGNYINHGSWKMFDERGNLMAQGTYDRGNRTGAWVRWYRSVTEAPMLGKPPYQQFPGPHISQATFKDDQIDGVWTIYDGKMRKISEWNFADGHRHGKSTWWFTNGKKMREIDYRNGDVHGFVIEWAPDGAVRKKDTYIEGRKLAQKTSNHQGGAKKSEGMYLFARDVEQTPDDWWNCKLMTTVKSGRDEKQGRWTSWHANGQKQLEGNYEHDLQVGQFIWWHPNGQKALEGNFDHGKQDGGWTWWYPTGQKSIQGEYVQGNPTGRWTWWKEDGKVAQSADLSHSEGVVIDMPKLPEPSAAPSPAPRMTTPPSRTPARR